MKRWAWYHEGKGWRNFFFSIKRGKMFYLFLCPLKLVKLLKERIISIQICLSERFFFFFGSLKCNTLDSSYSVIWTKGSSYCEWKNKIIHERISLCILNAIKKNNHFLYKSERRESCRKETIQSRMSYVQILHTLSFPFPFPLPLLR